MRRFDPEKSYHYSNEGSGVVLVLVYPVSFSVYSS